MKNIIKQLDREIGEINRMIEVSRKKAASLIEARAALLNTSIAAKSGYVPRLGRPPIHFPKAKRTISAAGLASIKRAQKERWARVRAAKDKKATTTTGRSFRRTT